MINEEEKQRKTNLLVGLVDLISLMLCYLIVSFVWFSLINTVNDYTQEKMVGNLGTLAVAFCIAFFWFNMNRYFLKRSALEEFMNVCKVDVVLAACVTLLIYLTHGADEFARSVFILTIVANVAVDTLFRDILKKLLKKYYMTQKSRVLLITTSDRAKYVIKHLNTADNWESQICGVVIIDKSMVGQKIEGVSVVADWDSMMKYAKREAIDEVFFHLPYNTGRSFHPYVKTLEDMGITVNINLNVLDQFRNYNLHVRKIGDFPVVTMAITFIDSEKLWLKRCIDIVGALVGCLITLIAIIFVGPAIYIESPGPIFFKQKRVGRNGRPFEIYKFRSMYMDAEERKKELMAQNEMQGFMFKMENDPRITKVGKFIRSTSIDELPQFFNVLKGDMSLVGTRPPTMDEFKQYEGYHKRRLSMKPGITGMWQVSGRSDITDFEEVVRLDTKYIDEWSLALDIKILFKTVWVVLCKVGSR